MQDHARIIHALQRSVSLPRLARLTVLLAAIGTLALLPHISMAHDASSKEVLPTIDDWTVWGHATVSGGITTFNANWNVPIAPSNYNKNDNPITFLFIGLEPSGAGWIVQPVLGYGCTSSYNIFGQCISPGIGGQFWWISAYWVQLGGTSHGDAGAIQVNTGDTIAGSLTWSSNCNGSGAAGYYISVNDNTIGQGNHLCYSTSSTWPDAFATLENYHLNYCNQLPNQQTEIFYSISSTTTLNFLSSGQNGNSPQCNYNKGTSRVTISSYPTTDFYGRSHGRSYDSSLPVPWWPPYQSNYEFKVTSSSFTYIEFKSLTAGNHYIQEAASGFVPSYAWHTTISVNGVTAGDGDVGRNQILQGNFNVNSYVLAWTPS
jgi:hypothetical protein